MVYEADHEAKRLAKQQISDACREYGTSPQAYRFSDSEVVTIFEITKHVSPSEKLFTDRQFAIIEWLREHPLSSRKEVAESMKLSIATLKREFETLVRLGVIVRDGEKKAAKWKIVG